MDDDIVGEDFGDDTEEESVIAVDKDVLTAIRAAFKAADEATKDKVRVVLGNYGGKLATEMKPSDVKSIQKILGI
jgi:hypothetical protein